MSMISDIRNGLNIIKRYEANAPIVTSAYFISVPVVNYTVMTPEDLQLMLDYGWHINPAYGYLSYIVYTIAEAADVDGQDIPAIVAPVVIPTVI